MALPALVATAVASREPGIAFLVKFDFLSETKRVWTGFGKIRTLDGQEWNGLGELVTIDGLSGAVSGAAPAGKLGISGVAPGIVRGAIANEHEFLQRPISIFMQAAQGLELIGNPCPIALRIMTSLEVSRQGQMRSISINHESPYIGRNNPAYSFYSDRDQQRRFPGDRACERTPFLINKTERFPDY